MVDGLRVGDKVRGMSGGGGGRTGERLMPRETSTTCNSLKLE